jgi:hypothetical protein
LGIEEHACKIRSHRAASAYRSPGIRFGFRHATLDPPLHTRYLITIPHWADYRFLIYAVLTPPDTSCASTEYCVEIRMKRTSAVHAALAACIAHGFIFTFASSARCIRANIVTASWGKHANFS